MVDVYLPSNVPVPAGSTVKLVVYEASNPSGAGAGTFSVATSSDPAPVGVSFVTAAAGSVSKVSLGPTSYSAGATHVSQEATFTATHAVSSGDNTGFPYCYETECGDGYIRLTAPAGTVYSTSPYYYKVTDGASSGVSGRVEVGPEGLGSNVVNVHLPPELSIAAGDTVKIQASEVTNPTSAESGTLAVSTSSDPAGASLPFNILAQTKVSGVSVSADSYSAGAVDVVEEVGFTASSPVSTVGGFVQLTGPAGSRFATGRVECWYDCGYQDYVVTDGANTGVASSVEVGPGGGGQNVVDVYLPSNVPVPAGSTVKLVVYEASNPSGAGAGTFSVATSSDPAPVGVSFVTAAAGSVSKVSLGPTSYSAGATHVSQEATFTATHAVSSGDNTGFPYCYETECGDGYIRLTAPAGTVYSTSPYYYKVTDGASSGVSGRVEVGPEGLGSNVVNVHSPPELSIAAGDTVKIQASEVTNPTSAEWGDARRVHFLGSRGRVVAVQHSRSDQGVWCVGVGG